MVLDHAGIEPNPARSPKVKLPRGERREVNPPTAEHVEAVVRLLPPRYRLPALVLDATGMRVGELEQLTWGDVDEPRGRWRVSAAVSKTGAARWVTPPPVLFEAVMALVPREDRTPERRVFQGFGADQFRTALTRACTAAGVPVVLAARPATPPRLAAAPRRDAVGADRRARRPRRPRRRRRARTRTSSPTRPSSTTQPSPRYETDRCTRSSGDGRLRGAPAALHLVPLGLGYVTEARPDARYRSL